MSDVYNVWLVEFELKQMAGYLKVLKKSLEDYAEKINDLNVVGDADVTVDEEANERFNEWCDEVLSVNPGGDFPRRLYSAFVVNWFSFIEDTLLDLCNDLNLQLDANLEGKKPGKGIWRARAHAGEIAHINRSMPHSWGKKILA
jgi:hypothetical protein